MSVARGVAVFFGVLFIVGAAIEFYIAIQNNQTLQENEALGYYNQSDEQLVQFQFTCATILLLLAAVSFAIAAGIRNKEKREVQQTKTVILPPPPPVDSTKQYYERKEEIRTYQPVEESTEKLSHQEFIEKLEALKRARDDGLISDEEFEEKKKELLKRL